MILSKFPVVSPDTGREYRVDVWDHRWGGINVDVYVETDSLFRWWRFKRVSEDGIFRSSYDEAEWNYDYRAMALHEIAKYEGGIRAQLEHETMREQGAKQFEEWNGKEAEQ